MEHFTAIMLVSNFILPRLSSINQVLIWDVETQPNRHAILGATESRPDLVGPLQGVFVSSSPFVPM